MTTPLLAESPAALDALSRIEVLYTDLDGTLLGRGGSLLVDADGEPALQTAEAVTAINVAGLPVVIVTGRNRIQCIEITRLLGWRGFIAELGCVIVPDRGSEPIYLTGDWADDTLAPGETPYERIVRAGAVEALQRAFPGRLEPHAPYHLNREATVLLRGSLDLAEARGVLGELEVGVQIVDNGIVHPLSTGLTHIAEIHAYHLMPPGVTKAGAVALDLARRGLAREQAASIGDAATDVGMADFTAIGVVVANALADARVQGAVRARDNVYALTRGRGEGWAEFSAAWIAAREAR
ncbi:MAG TPA: HAD hydrolase family protein [Coriobacteriia bacterium]